MTAKVRGKDRLFAKLRRELPATLNAEMAAAALQTGRDMAATSRGMAPVDDGDLRASIAVTPAGQTTPPHSQPGGSTLVPPGAAMVTAGNTAVRYAHLVEFGTAAHPQGGTGEGTFHPGTAPAPFFWPAYRLIRRKAQTRFRRALKKSVDKVGG